MNKENKIIYISGPGYSAVAMAPIFDDVSRWCKFITNKFSIASENGNDISVRFSINYEKNDEYKDINAHAGRDKSGSADYEICLYAGLIYNQWVYSRLPIGYLEPFSKVMAGLTDLEDKGKNEHLSNVIFYMSTVFIYCHELAHILLGHIGWRHERIGRTGLLEVDDGTPTVDFLEATFAMEGEADALAASLLLTICSISCLSNETFGTLQDGLWTLGFASTITMHLFENKILLNGPPAHRTHPSPTERWFMFFAHLLPNVQKLYPKQPELESAIRDGAMTAFRLTGLGNLYSNFDPIAHASLMAEIGEQLERTGLESHRLFLKSGGALRKVRVA